MSEVKNYLMYFVCVSLLFLFLFFSVRIFEKKNNIFDMKIHAMVNTYDNKNVKDESKSLDISYPLFQYELLDEKIDKFISQYRNKENILISYDLFVSRDLVNIFFTINDNGKIFYEAINYSIKKNDFVSNDDIFDFKVLGENVLSDVKVKYSSYVYSRVVEDNFKSVHLDLEDNGVYIYFDSKIFENVQHKVFVFYSSEDEQVVNDFKYDKVIAFTFDDGPSKYTKDLVDTLIANDSKATFFELGNRMKYNQEIVLDAYNRGMEVASHTYAHKNLNKLSEEAIDEEINSTNIIFNEITGGSIPFVRPPYGNANDKVKSRVSVPLINWNVDTLDWVSRNSEAIYNHILENVTDGDIVLMHDIYPETIEAVKMVLPVLRERGFKVTSVGELAREKGAVLESGHIYRSFK